LEPAPVFKINFMIRNFRLSSKYRIEKVNLEWGNSIIRDVTLVSSVHLDAFYYLNILNMISILFPISTIHFRFSLLSTFLLQDNQAFCEEFVKPFAVVSVQLGIAKDRRG
jgi:hypothetical protein